MMQIRHLPKRCYSSNKIRSVDGAVVHFISAKTILPEDPFNRDAIIGIFEDYKLSAHYLIERDGNIIELVPDLHKAHHAGKSRMNGRDGCNGFTIGYELVGGTDWPYTGRQLAALSTSLAQHMTAHRFTSDWVQGHDQVRADWNAEYPDKQAAKKVDPGTHFPWDALKDMLAGVSAAVKDVKL